MDYMNEKDIIFYKSAEIFFKNKQNEKIILMTTKASVSYSEFKFKKMIQFYLGEKVLEYLKKYIR